MNRIGHYANECRSSGSNSTQNTRQLTRFRGRGRTPCGRGFTPRRQINEATEVPEAKSNEKSDLDIVRLMEACRLSKNSPQTSSEQRIQVDDIEVIDIGFEHIVHIVNATTKEFTMPVLHGKLGVCLYPRTLNSVLRHNVHNAKRFLDVINKLKGFKYPR